MDVSRQRTGRYELHYLTLALLVVTSIDVASYNFYPVQHEHLGSNVRGVSIGDVDNDSRNEVLVTTSVGGEFAPELDHKLFVFEYSADSGLILEQKLAISPVNIIQQSWSVDVADLNGDGLNDVAVGVEHGVGLFYQNSEHLLDPISTVFSPREQESKTRWVRAGDFNGDGRIDLVATSSGVEPGFIVDTTESIDIYLQNQQGVLVAPTSVDAQEELTEFFDLIVVDVNIDGIDDVVLVGRGASTTTADFGVYLGSETPPYLIPTAFENTPQVISSAAFGDIDNDGIKEIIVAQFSSLLFYEFSNNTLVPDGSYTKPIPSGRPDFLATTDINDDGLLDIVLGAGGSLTYFDVLVQEQNQQFSSFSLANPSGYVFRAHGASVGDISNDGKVDIAMSGLGNPFFFDSISLLINGDQNASVLVSGTVYLDDEFNGILTDDSPLDGIEVRLYDEANILRDAKITNSDGEYALSAVPGIYQIEVGLPPLINIAPHYGAPDLFETNSINPATRRSDLFEVKPLRDKPNIDVGLTYTRDNAKLLPLTPGAIYQYLDDGTPETNTVDENLTVWNGIPVSRVVGSDGIDTFLTNDDAIQLHGGIAYSNNSTQIYTPPIVLHAGDEDLHRIHGVQGNVTISIPPTSVAYPFSNTRTIIGYEQIDVPAGIFSALRIDSSLRLTAANGEYVWTGGTDWLTPGVGVVRSTSYGPDSGPESIRELQSYTIDFDGDGYDRSIDNCEFMFNADQSDADNDGVGDACDIDHDNDLRPNIIDNCPTVMSMNILDTDNDGFGNPCDDDDDGDNIPDTWEINFGLDPLDPADAFDDPDNDGLNNLAEYINGSDPTVADISHLVPTVPRAFQIVILAIFVISSLRLLGGRKG